MEMAVSQGVAKVRPMLRVMGRANLETARLLTACFYPFGDSQGIIAGGLREDEEELVASEAPEEIIGAKAGGDDFDDLPERGVACGVTRGVVDLFEVIDVYECDGELVAVSFGANEFECEALVDTAPIECAGDVVV
jgi:hypothetical protein